MRRRRNTLRFFPTLSTVTMRARVLKSKRKRPKRARGGERRGLVVAVIVVLIVPVIAYGAHELVKWLHRAPKYIVQEIRVEGAMLFTPEEIVAKSKLTPGVPILDTPIRRARRALTDDPMIRAATVVRRLPDTIVIEVTERAPIARLSSGGKDFLVDGDGYVFPLTEREFMATLPRIKGVSLKDPEPGARVENNEKLTAGLLVIELYLGSSLPELMQIDTVDVHNLRKVRLYPAPGPKTAASDVFTLGDGEFGRRLARLDAALRTQHTPLGKVDLSRQRVSATRN